MTKQRDQRVTLSDFSDGLVNKGVNPLDFSPKAFRDGRNVEAAEGIKVRGGCSIVSTDLPNGQVRALKQARFPMNEKSRVIAQVDYLPDLFTQQVDDGAARSQHFIAWDDANSRLLIFGGSAPLVSEFFPAIGGPWTNIAGSQIINASTGYRCQGAYDSTSDRALLWGIRNWISGGNFSGNNIYTFDFATDTMTLRTCSGAAGTVIEGPGCFRSTGGTLAVFNPVSTAYGATYAVYILNLSTYAWSQTGTTGVPAVSSSFVRAIYRAADDCMYVYGCGASSPYTQLWKYSFAGNTWTQLATNDTLEAGWYSFAPALVLFGTRLLAIWGFHDNTTMPYRVASVYDIGTDTWGALTIEGAPEGRFYHAACVTTAGQVFVQGGRNDPEGNDISELWLMDDPFSGAPLTRQDRLFASDDALPSTVAQFVEIYELGEGAGTVSISQLNDRTVITEGVNKRPLVWAGTMATDGSDGAVPKAVLISPDGANYYSGPEVLDKDADTATDVANIKMNGAIYVGLDVPEVEQLYVTMGTPNTGLAPEAQVYTNTEQFDDAATILRHDLKAGIVQWYKDSAGKGHFEGAEIDVDAAAAVNKGGGKVGIPATGHGLSSGQRVRLEGTINYNGDYVLDATTSANEMVITHGYVAETFNVGTEKARKCLKLGAGQDCPDVVQGMVVKFADAEVSILTITSTGDDTDQVELSADHTTAAVSAVYGLVVDTDDANLTVNAVASAAMIESMNKTLNSPPFIHSPGVSVRQIIKGSDLAASGDYIKVTIQVSDVASAGTFYNDNVYLLGASIVERSGTTGNGTTAPTLLTGLSGSIIAGASKTSQLVKFTIDETKDYLISMDMCSYRTYFGSKPYSYEPSYGKNLSIFLKQRYTDGGGYYFRVGGGKGGYAAYGQASCRSSQNLPAGFTDYSAHTTTVGVSKIEVQTSRSAPTALHVACTTDTLHLPVYFADAFVSMSMIVNQPGTSKIYPAFSLDGRSTWKVFKAGAFREVAKLDGVWKYKDGADAWQNASTNDMLTALRQAFGIAANQMTVTELNAMTAANWALTGGVIPKITAYVDLAVGMQVGGDGSIPSLTSYSVTFNDEGSVIIEGFVDGAWTPGDGWSDGTISGGIPLAQSGAITYQGASPMSLDYQVVNGVPAYWLRIRPNGTSPDTSITRILYKGPCQPLANIGDGQPSMPNGFIYVDTSKNNTLDFTEQVQDNVLTNFSVAELPLQTDDYLYVGAVEQFNAVEMIPTENNNANTATLSGEIWTGSEWVALTITDGTAGSAGKTLSGTGKVTWDIPSNWKMNIPFDKFLSRAYWVRFKVSAALTATTEIAECRVYCVPPALKKHRYAEVAGDTLFIANRPDNSNQVDVSRPLEEYGFFGDLSWSGNVGGQDAIVAMTSAYDRLIIWKPGSVHLWNGQGFESAEAAGRTPINGQCVVKATANGKSGMFFLNRTGAYFIQGLQADNTWSTAAIAELSSNLTFWDSTATPRLDLNYLHLCCGESWAKKNWLVWSVPMILTGSSQTTNNVLLVFDLNLMAWLPLFVFPFGISALCAAYTDNANAPQRLGDQVLLAGTYDGRIIRLFDPAATDDLGTPITWYAETGWLHYGDASSEDELSAVWLFGTSTGDVTLTTTSRYNYHESLTQPAASTRVFSDLSGVTDQLGLTKEVYNQREQGNYFKHRISGSGPAQICGLTVELALERSE